MKERILHLDLLKAFAIFLVLWGHSIQYFLSSDYWDEPFYRGIYSFHMPLFMALVGYFSAGCHKKPFLKVFSRRFRQLILPSLSFTLAGALLHGSLPGWLALANGYWFLKSAFVCTMLYYASRVLPGRWLFWALLSLAVSLYIPWAKVQLMYPEFLLGVMLRSWEKEGKLESRWLLAVSGLVFVAMLVPFDADFWLYRKTAWRILYRIVLGGFGSLFFFLVFRRVFTLSSSGLARWGGAGTRRRGDVGHISLAVHRP